MIGTCAGRNKALVGLTAVFALALLLRWPVASIPLERDEGEYAYIAQRWLQGEVPYKTAFDQKPPGIFALYALFISCIGTSAAALHWGMQVYTLGTLALIYWLGRRLFSAEVGLASAALCAFMTGAPCVFGQSANTETALLLPLTAGLAATLCAVEHGSARWSSAAGACAAAALLCKQTALFPVAVSPLLIITAAGTGRWRLLGALVLGAAALLAPVLGYFAWNDAWRELYDCVIGYNLSYAASIPLEEYQARFWRTFLYVFITYAPIYCLAGAAVLWGWRAGAPSPPAPCYPRVPLLTLWLILSFLSTAVGGRFFEHYFVTTIPATALLAGVGADVLTRRTSGGWFEALRRFRFVAVAIGYGVLLAPWYYRPGDSEEKSRLLYRTDIFNASLRASRFIAEDSAAGDTIFVMGHEPQIYYYTGLKSASRYIFTYPLIGTTADARLRQQSVLKELTEKPPEYIIIIFHPGYQAAAADWCDTILDLVRRSYVLAAVLPVDRSGPATPAAGRAETRVGDQDMASYESRKDASCISIYRRSHSAGR